MKEIRVDMEKVRRVQKAREKRERAFVALGFSPRIQCTHSGDLYFTPTELDKLLKALRKVRT